ncbi:hypothetical protein Sulku_1722 [Sulfuricurvum kujiense DSM 16994]|uniref:Uncharacterized protein n=1 Tax=Sulfuricurvum kujiense (strain ATCC BAA-921 / DSM 16994 / JCM 11577 / YK-1) TaxID=709032 RepID=E4U0Y1_SULKY|nr:hypothetical protein [Sulfuricurvum kujiense]ADR34383.1 hypothetical protein Sulku_1722 [Sulfuricurvum kujiense DSM 16994]
MSINTPIVFIGIPHSNPALDDAFQTYILNNLSHLRIEPITVLDGKNIPQWNFVKAYFVDVAPINPAFNLLISEFGGNDGSDLDAILIGFNTRKHYLNLFDTLLEQAQ